MVRVPQTSVEWKKALIGIKKDYLERKYRSCLKQCLDLLDGAKVARTAQAVHLIYLHFYAASTLESQLRCLHQASEFRMQLLKQAQDHYYRASVLAEAELESVGYLLRSSAGSSLTNSQYSFVSSQDSLSTRMSSPSPTFEFEDIEKRLSITNHSTPNEPYVRPDSPTLGPFSPCTSPEPGARELVEELPEALRSLTASPNEPADQLLLPSPIGDDESFNRAQALHRYASAITFIRRQIAHHVLTSKETPSPPAPSNEEMRALDLKARIERLRAEGWQRKRFDPRRYDALCEAALADLAD
ncbi:unnamed protein product [Clonostachys rosea]|uniref:Uncharacterized protein n=1 Tax=Bionectria ochroleuca TaxID=29856 RepID=A0ABY6UB68_BIOOC|nr:unnamed protein product [Clonostachys rosea]